MFLSIGLSMNGYHIASPTWMKCFTMMGEAQAAVWSALIAGESGISS